MKAYAVILCKGFNGKSRLGLDPERRRELQRALLRDIHGQLAASGHFARVIVATPDDDVVAFCRAGGIEAMKMDSRDINRSLQEVTVFGEREGYDTLFITASDLPLFSAGMVDAVLERLEALLASNPRGAVFCPSRNMGMTVCAASPPGSVRLFVDGCTPNLLLLDKVAGPTPRRLQMRTEAFLDIDTDENLAEVFHLMREQPEYHAREFFAFVAHLFGEKETDGLSEGILI